MALPPPDGRFVTRPDGAGLHRVTTPPDRSNLRALVIDHGTTGISRFEALQIEQSFNSVWSPDGSTIMFSHFRTDR